MASVLVIGLIASLLVSSATSQLLNTEDAKMLTNQLRFTFNENNLESLLKSSNKKRLTNLYINSFYNKLPKEQDDLIINKINHLNDDIKAAKSHWRSMEKFEHDYNIARNLKKELIDITAQHVYVNEHAENVDEQLYSEPSIFDLLAHNKGSETDCVTYKSSVRKIKSLYYAVLDFEIRKAASELYASDMHKKLATSVDLKPENVMFSRMQQRVQKLHKTADSAINIAREEIKKCKQKERI